MKITMFLGVLLFPILIAANYLNSNTLLIEEEFEGEFEEVQLALNEPDYKKLMYGSTIHYCPFRQTTLNRIVFYGRLNSRVFTDSLSFEFLPHLYCAYVSQNEKAYSDQKVISGTKIISLLHLHNNNLNIILPYLVVGYTLPNESSKTLPSFRYHKGLLTFRAAFQIWYNFKFDL